MYSKDLLKEWLIPLATGLIGVVLGAVFQDGLLPRILHRSISNSTVEIYFRTKNEYFVDVLVLNNSDDTLDVNNIEVILREREGKGPLSAYLSYSKIFLVDNSEEFRFANLKKAPKGTFVLSINASNSIPPGGRELFGVKFVDPQNSDISIEGFNLTTPQGAILHSDGNF